ncbi:transposase [Microcoleus sp. Pol11C2]|uniref:transposase n=1 Tax=Microcoleus sp. Pol11C2 TaxID=3055389 RepID=UPI003B03AA51
MNYASLFFKESASTIVNLFEGIGNYFLNHTTSGVMERINNRIKLIMRQGYGFSNFAPFRACITLLLELDKDITVSSREPNEGELIMK